MRDQDLARYCEAMVYDYEPQWRPDGLVEIDRPDALMWKRAGFPAWANRVAYVKWSEADADRNIAEALNFFGDVPFTWHVGPSSAPADLEARLLAHGLSLGERPRLMTAPLPLRAAFRSADVRVVEVSDQDAMRQWLEFAHPGEVLDRDLEERLRYLRFRGRTSGYLLAFADETAVANAAYRWSSDGRCMYLTGAGTREDHRGRGIYQTLVAYRARMAEKHGCEIVSILANRNTSAPILARHGFADHGEMPWFRR